MGYVPGVQCVHFDRRTGSHQKSFSVKLWVVNCLRENRWSKKGRISMEDGIIVPNSSTNPWIRIIHSRLLPCDFTFHWREGSPVPSPLSLGLASGKWAHMTIWALRRPCMFLLVFLAAGPRAGRETGALEWTRSPLEVCSWGELTHILDGPRNSADLGARKRHSCCCKAMSWGDSRYVPFLQQ